MKRFGIAALAVLGTFATACSGTDGTGLLGDSGTQNQDDAAQTQDDASTQNDAGVEDATTTSDASTEDAHVVDATPDTHVGPPDSKIQCGTSTCSAQNEMCCWHQASTTKPYECVSGVSACAGTYDVPMTCSTPDNCASQGNPTYQCCATGGNFGSGTQCGGFDIASLVACKATCDQTDYELGCSVKQQNCSDSLQTCVVSKCTVPGITMCY